MIREQIRNVDEYNQLVPLALGLMSALERFAAIVEQARDPESRDADDAPTRNEEDPLVLVSLGLLSMRRTLDQRLHVACQAHAATKPPEAHTKRTEIGGLLR